MSLFKTDRAKSLFSAYSIICLDNFGFGIVFILFAPLILDGKYGMVNPETTDGMRNIILGILFATFPLAQFFGAPFFGDFADFFGRKKALYLTVFGTTVGYLFSGFAIIEQSIIFLIISRLVTGFFAGNLGICLAVISDLSPNEKTRAKNFGIVTIIFGISWPFAILVGGYLSDPTLSKSFTPDIPFWITAALSILSLLILKILFIETHAEKLVHFSFTKGVKDIVHAFKIQKMRPYLFVVLLWTLGWFLAVQWYADYSLERFSVSQELISWGLIFMGFLWCLGGAIVNPLLLRKYSILQVTLISFCFSTFFLFLSSFFNFHLFSLFFSIAAITGSVVMSNALNLVSISSPKEIQGLSMGIGQSMMSLGAIIVPLIGGLLGKTDIQLLYPTSALFFCIGLGVILKKTIQAKFSN